MPGPHTQDAAQVRSEIWQRREIYRQVLQLAAAGASAGQIANVLEERGIKKSEASVRTILKNAIKKMEAAMRLDSDKALSLELHRIDLLLQATFPRATNTKDPQQLKAVETVLKLMERRAAYLGLDSPDRHELVIKTGATEEERKEVERMRQAWIESGGDQVDGQTVDSTAVELPPGPDNMEGDGPRAESEAS